MFSEIIKKIVFLCRAVMKIDVMPEILDAENQWKDKSLFTAFLLPIAALIAVEIFVCYHLYIDDTILEVSLIKPIFYVLKTFVSYFFFSKMAEFYAEKILYIDIDKDKLGVLLFLLYFSSMIVDGLLIFLPSMFFIKFFNAYIYYQAWHIANLFFDLEEKARVQFTLVVPSLLIVLNIFSDNIIKLLAPNIPI